jgi:DNA-binding transcriptional LysR family regulator
VNLPLPTPDIVTEPLFSEDLLLFVPAEHPLANATDVPMSAITTLPLFLPPRGTSFRELIDQAATAEGVTLTSRADLDGIRLIASMAIAGQGAAIVPATAIPTDLRDRTSPVTLPALPRREVGVALRRRAMPGAPARAFLEVVRELVQGDEHRPEHVHPY